MSRPHPDAPQAAVAVVTVCRNSLALVQSTVASVQRQRWQPLLHVLVDGASTDGTPEWLEANRARFACAISEPDLGIYDAMNKAIDLCPPVDWIIFLNAGDQFATDTVLADLARHLTGPADFIFGGVAIRGPAGTRTIAARNGSSRSMPGCHQAMLVRASLMRSLRFDTRYRVGADFECFLRGTGAGGRFVIHPGIVAEIAPEGFSSANEVILQRDYFLALARHRGWAAACGWILHRRLRNGVKRMLTPFLPGLKT